MKMTVLLGNDVKKMFLTLFFFCTFYVFGQNSTNDWYIFNSPKDQILNDIYLYYSESCNIDTISRSQSFIFNLFTDEESNIKKIIYEDVALESDLGNKIINRFLEESVIIPEEFSEGNIVFDYEVLVRFEKSRIVIFFAPLYRDNIKG